MQYARIGHSNVKLWVRAILHVTKFQQRTSCFIPIHRDFSESVIMSTTTILNTVNIIKSPEDKRLYRGIELSNHLKVLLVSDSTTDKSAAALDVNVGYMSDPDNVPGLAHFCEHMLFLGTKKFPTENEYTKFLSEHGGSSNACTYPDHTKYFFDVVPEHLKATLDRFSQFFLAPLFTESATDRELNAVNSEHEKNVPVDTWRLDQLDKHTANPKHPYSKFGTGNKQTLDVIPKQNGINVRDELLKFHKKWYSSNIMSLVVLGKESLNELEEMVVELFSEVDDKGVEAPKWLEHPFTREQLQLNSKVVPVKDVRNLNISFPIPDLHEFYKSGPGHYVSHLVGHEGPGSLLSALKARGWSSSLVGGSRPAARGFGFFGISMDLTEEGMEHVDDIIKLIFQYINMLKQEGPKKWIQDEHSEILAMLFRFKDKEMPRSFVSNYVHGLQEYPMEEAISGGYLLTEWRPDLIENVLSYFTVENIRVAVVAKKFANETNLVEPWYGTQYRFDSIPEETLNMWKNADLCNELHLPPVNEFLPTNFDLMPIDKDITQYPVIIHDTAITRVWFKQDDEFCLPKANMSFDFVSPLAYMDPLNYDLTHMFVQLFRDSLNEYAYAAEIAGMKWDLANTKYGMILGVGGYSNKQSVLLDKIMEKMTNFKIDPKRFEILKENYIRGLKNFAAEQPYQHAVYYLALLLTEHAWTKDELLQAMNLVTVDRLEAFIPQLLSKMHIECLVHGNVNKEKALELVGCVEKRLTSTFTMSPLLPRQLVLNREINLDDECNYLYEVENSVHRSSCAELYFQCGVQSTESNILLELYLQLISEPCFDILRTKEQLGYMVFSGIRRSNGVQGLRVIVQSNKHPKFVDQRVESFIANMLDYIINMSDEEYSRHKEALAAQRLEKPKRLSGLSSQFWAEITSQQYNFDRANIEVAYLRKVTKDEIIQFHKQLLFVGAKHRNKMAVHVISTAEGGAGTELTNGPSSDNEIEVVRPAIITDIMTFKTTQAMFPLVQPFISITRKGNRSKL